MAVVIAKRMDLDNDVIEGVNIAGLIHDIGINYFPAEKLNRPAPLTHKEQLMLQEHPTKGYEIMSTFDFVRPVAKFILQQA